MSGCGGAACGCRSAHPGVGLGPGIDQGLKRVAAAAVERVLHLRADARQAYPAGYAIERKAHEAAALMREFTALVALVGGPDMAETMTDRLRALDVAPVPPRCRDCQHVQDGTWCVHPDAPEAPVFGGPAATAFEMRMAGTGPTGLAPLCGPEGRRFEPKPGTRFAPSGAGLQTRGLC